MTDQAPVACASWSRTARETAAGRLSLFRAARAISPGVLAAMVCLYVLLAVLPLSAALSTGLLVQRLAGDSPRLGPVVFAVTLIAAVVIAQQAVLLLLVPVVTLARHQVDGWVRARAAAAAMRPDGIAHLEDDAVRDTLRLATGETLGATAGLAVVGQLSLSFQYLTAVLAAAVIAVASVPVAVAALGAVWTMRMLVVRQALKLRNQFAEQSHNARRSDYWADVAADPRYAMEVRVFGLSGWAVERFSRYAHRQYPTIWRIRAGLTARHWSIFAIGLLVTALALVVLADRLADGDVGIGAMTAAVTALWVLFGLARVDDDAFDVELGLAAVQAAHALNRRLRDLPRQPAGAANGAGVANGAGAVSPANGAPGVSPTNGAGGRQASVLRFEGVGFRYPHSARRVLDGIDLTVRRGEVLAIVGLNGAGKTTLVKLLAGLYRPDQGRITVDGLDLTGLSTAWWRRQLATVFQDFIRYELTAADNVAMGAVWHPPEPEWLHGAAADAGIVDLVERLPSGWDTPLSPVRTGGTDLSGGQWQRVAIARAMYALRAGARFLVLDEPTAHLDVTAEQETFRRIIERRGDAGVVLISHRLATVRTADRIVLLSGGRIVEEGDHEALLAGDGQYARMFRLQAARFLAPDGGDGRATADRAADGRAGNGLAAAGRAVIGQTEAERAAEARHGG